MLWQTTVLSQFCEKVTATAVCLRLCSVSQDDGFCGNDDLFSDEDDGFLVKMKDFFIFLRLRQCLHCILMSEAPTLSMCGHTNEGIPSTEHVSNTSAALGMCRHNNEGKSTD